MIISNSWNFVFIHLHKCAGTSVEVALSKILNYNDILIGSTPEGEKQQEFFKRTIGLNKHSTAREVQKFLGAEHWEHMFSFAFVRHPLHRLYSLYNYSLKLAAPHVKSEHIGKPGILSTLPSHAPMTFNSVKAAISSKNFNEFVLNDFTWKDPGAMSQSSSLSNDKGLMIKKFYKVERMEESWNHVLARFPGAGPLERLNTSLDRAAGNDPKTLLGEEAKRKVQDAYARDFSTFEYQF
ncbi:MAG: hypothetical protein CMK09_06455 [Ponticaulis sp.]|nr:hypothetical protein [Ponticaulis sp.]|tara:strand:- start:8774 stop:9487 length:714 start_codon:yes stop_codon:yes gene_type:complete